MAKLRKNLIRIQGSIGDLNFYERNGVLFVRKKGGGFNAEAIQNKKSMEPVRQNASEFGECSRTKRHYQHKLDWFYENFRDGTLHGRLMRLFTKIKNLDKVSPRGKRKVYRGLETAEGRQLFEQFVYTPKCRIGHRLGGRIQFDKISRSVFIGGLIFSEKLYPKGATHLELSLTVVDFDFRNNKGGIHPVKTLRIPKGEIPSEMNMVFEELPVKSGMELVFLSLRFYQEAGGRSYYHQRQNVGLELIGALWG